MPAIVREKLIPIYSLSESSPAGSTLFEIHESKGVLPRRKADFLIPHRKDYLYSDACERTGRHKFQSERSQSRTYRHGFQ